MIISHYFSCPPTTDSDIMGINLPDKLLMVIQINQKWKIDFFHEYPVKTAANFKTTTVKNLPSQ